MANRQKGDVDLKIGAESYKLRLDMNAFAEFEELTGEGLVEVCQQLGRLASDGGGIDFKLFRMVRSLVWAALLHERPQITPREVGAILESIPGNITEKFVLSMTAVMDAFSAAMGTGNDEAKEKKAART